MPIAANLYYNHYSGERVGEYPPLVMIHGAGGNHLHWHPNLRRIKGYQIYALDLPGHGKSAGVGYQSITQYVDSILEWMEAVELHKAVFVGHSMGSAIAITIALDHPIHVLGLVLIGSGARLKVNAELLDASSSETTYRKAIDKIVKWSFYPDSPAELLEAVTRRMEEVRPSVLHGDFIACDGFNEIERIARIYKPTLVICGEQDQMTPVRYSQYLADNIANSQLVIVPKAGHMVTLEQPELVIDAIEDFIPAIRYWI